jgi:hypothetical protein
VIRALGVARKYAGACILIVYSLYHGVVSVRTSMLDYVRRTSPDLVTLSDQRFETIKLRIRSDGYNKVGYLTNIPEGMDWSGVYLRTQYALAPILVDDSTNPALVVANLREPYSVRSCIRDKDVVTIADFGNGVLLLTRRTR